MLDDVRDALDQALTSSVSAGKSEVQTVKDYVTKAASIPQSREMQVKTSFIHQRPYVFFVNPQEICGRTKCELGDILYVFKTKDSRGVTIESRALFVQVKKQSNNAWLIEPHQLEFWSDIARIEFRFGNKVYKDGGMESITYSGLQNCQTLAAYLLVSDELNLGFEVERVKQKQKKRESTFSIRVTNPITCVAAQQPLCSECDSHSSMLSKLFSNTVGANIRGRLNQIVNLVYKKIGWEFDPPEEYADYFEEDGRGFGVIEVTYQPERFEERPRRGAEQ